MSKPRPRSTRSQTTQFKECMACGMIIKSLNWQLHVAEAHPGAKKVLFKNYQDEDTMSNKADFSELLHSMSFDETSSQLGSTPRLQTANLRSNVVGQIFSQLFTQNTNSSFADGVAVTGVILAVWPHISALLSSPSVLWNKLCNLRFVLAVVLFISSFSTVDAARTKYQVRDCHGVAPLQTRCGISKNLARSLPSTFLLTHGIADLASYLKDENYNWPIEGDNIERLEDFGQIACDPFLRTICNALIPKIDAKPCEVGGFDDRLQKQMGKFKAEYIKESDCPKENCEDSILMTRFQQNNIKDTDSNEETASQSTESRESDAQEAQAPPVNDEVSPADIPMSVEAVEWSYDDLKNNQKFVQVLVVLAKTNKFDEYMKTIQAIQRKALFEIGQTAGVVRVVK